ncbi:MAG TPA: cytochrome P450 [Conexibacter sp.]|nr:cytochrome P450 [Conexibacter sp.]
MEQTFTFRTGRAPRALPLVGHALALRLRPLAFLSSLPAAGDLVTIRLGPQKAFVATHPELVRQLLNESRTFDKGGPLFDKLRELLGNGLASSAYEPHRRQRRLVQPAFRPDRLPGYAGVMAEEIGAVTASWRDGAELDVHAAMYGLTTRIAARTMFAARDAEEAVAEVSTALPAILDVVFKRMTTPLGPFERLRVADNRCYDEAVASMRRVAQRLIDEYRSDGADHGDLLSMLLAARDDDGAGLSDEELLEHVVAVLGAGADTTAATLSWALHLVATHPDVEERLHAEVDAAVAGPIAGWSNLPALPLTARIVRETLRLHPPGWLFTRLATADAELGGQAIPRGSIVLWSPYVLHRRPDLFAQPGRFDPDRGLGEDGPAVRGAHLPFGGGARKCIGKDFGSVEVALALASIARSWRLEPLPGSCVRPVAHISLHPHPLRMRLRARS